MTVCTKGWMVDARKLLIVTSVSDVLDFAKS